MHIRIKAKASKVIAGLVRIINPNDKPVDLLLEQIPLRVDDDRPREKLDASTPED